MADEAGVEVAEKEGVQQNDKKEGASRGLDEWTHERLTGKAVSFKNVPEEKQAGANAVPVSPSRRNKKKVQVKMDPMVWGSPGHLTDEEADCFFKFKEEIAKRGQEWRDTVYCFGEEEGEVNALCRWLRARKFVYEDVIKMVAEATECRKEAKSMDFYPDPKIALGCDPSLYYKQYPQLYSGSAKNGAPIFISKPGVVNVDAIECLTTLESIVKFHWYIMTHDFAARLRAQKAKDPRFKRFECLCILDLDNLTMSQITQRLLDIVKVQSAIDSLCFPETMYKMFIVNVPRFFGLTWKIIKGWLDPRTANKVEVISQREVWSQKILELVDEEQLPSDYGGKGENTQVTIEKEAYQGDLKRMHTEVMYLRGHGSTTYQVNTGEHLEVSVYSRSIPGAKFTLTDAKHGRPPWVEDFEVKHTGTGSPDEVPTHTIITKTRIQGPANIKVKADSHAGRFSTQNYLVVFQVFAPK